MSKILSKFTDRLLAPRNAFVTGLFGEYETLDGVTSTLNGEDREKAAESVERAPRGYGLAAWLGGDENESPFQTSPHRGGFQLMGEGNDVKLASVEHAVGEFGNVGVHASLFAQDTHELLPTGFALGTDESFEKAVATVVELYGL